MDSDPRRYPPRPHAGVGAVVFNGTRVLLIERGKAPLKGWWTVPGGMIETGEAVEDAVRREALEETGLHVRPVAVAAVFERITRDDNGAVEFHHIVVDCLCELEGGTLAAASDVAAAGWFTLEEMATMKMAPGTPEVVARAWALRQAAPGRNLGRVVH
jgi:ADP-ribose pyrophosphatase YjhB (NUDIX family)